LDLISSFFNMINMATADLTIHILPSLLLPSLARGQALREGGRGIVPPASSLIEIG
jgi:hypothetical protein